MAEGNTSVPAALIRQGLIPCAPFSPTLAATTPVLELYRNTHLRRPHLALQPFIRSLCNTHGIPFRPYLSQQFSICYGVYLRLCEDVKVLVDPVLGRGGKNWRLRHTCRRILKGGAALDPEPGEAEDGPRVGESIELKDSREVGGITTSAGRR